MIRLLNFETIGMQIIGIAAFLWFASIGNLADVVTDADTHWGIILLPLGFVLASACWFWSRYRMLERQLRTKSKAGSLETTLRSTRRALALLPVLGLVGLRWGKAFSHLHEAQAKINESSRKELMSANKWEDNPKDILANYIRRVNRHPKCLRREFVETTFVKLTESAEEVLEKRLREMLRHWTALTVLKRECYDLVMGHLTVGEIPGNVSLKMLTPPPEEELTEAGDELALANERLEDWRRLRLVATADKSPGFSCFCQSLGIELPRWWKSEET